MLNELEIELAERLVRLHDGKNYSALQEMSMPPADLNDDGKITEEMYIQMCSDIENEMGDIESIDPIDVLMRADSKLTLWKVKYSKSDFMAFWAIGFDLETSKVQDVLVQW
ncbi:hypothetical protein [uncultured Amphritea sp.]|uniref:hypothetical protein n=1 Tax=uncultured Amphritea sp. TaxID=981605 RepID=UPI00263557EA|nr:hypothetical protein [uncultured Amphritea sp.]